jgi:hypothetical protein
MTWSHRNLAEPIPPEAIYPPQNGLRLGQPPRLGHYKSHEVWS